MCYNRAIVELKGYKTLWDAQTGKRYNRAIVELKGGPAAAMLLDCGRYNRAIVELKEPLTGTNHFGNRSL